MALGDILGGLGGIGEGYLRGTSQLQQIQSQQYAQALRALAMQQQMKQQQAQGPSFQALLGGGLDNLMGGGGAQPSMAPGQVQQQPLPQVPQAAQQMAAGPGDVRGSWFGNSPGWSDPSDSGLQAGGQPVSAGPGIALPDRSTLGQNFNVTAPSGQTMTLPQTDIGPAKWTGRGVDINAPAAQAFGYSPKNFPTDSLFHVVRADIQKTVGPEAVQAAQPATQQAMQSFGNPQAFTGRLDPSALARAIKKANPDQPDDVNMAVFSNLFPLLSNAGKQQFAQQWEMYKQGEHEREFGVAQGEKAREFGLREGELQQNRQAMQGFAQQRLDQAAGKGEGQGFVFLQTPQGIVRANPRTGQVEPAALPEGTTKFGGAGQQKWSDDAINALIEQGMAGDASLMAKLPRSGPARQQYEEGLAKRLNESPGGLTGGVAQMQMNQMRMAEAKAAAQTAGRVTINSEVYQAEAQGAGQMVIDASKAVPRTEMKPVNQILNAYYSNSGDPNIIRLGQALVALYNAYGKMSNPTGTGVHDADKARIEQTLNAALSQGQVEAGVDQIIKEGANLMGAAYKAQTDVLKNVMPLGGSLPPQSATPSGTDYSKMTDQQLIDLSKQQGQ